MKKIYWIILICIAIYFVIISAALTAGASLALIISAIILYKISRQKEIPMSINDESNLEDTESNLESSLLDSYTKEELKSELRDIAVYIPLPNDKLSELSKFVKKLRSINNLSNNDITVLDDIEQSINFTKTIKSPIMINWNIDRTFKKIRKFIFNV